MRRPAPLALLVIALAAGSSAAAEGDESKKPPRDGAGRCPNCGHGGSEGEEARNLLLNPGVESGRGDAPSVWVAASGPARPDGPRMTRTTERPHSGRAALAIAYDGPKADTPAAFNWAQPLAEAPVGRTLRLRAWIKSEAADAANVCLQCWDERDEMLAFVSTPVFRGDQDWVEARSGPVVVPPGTARVVVRAALTGRGKVWFDDLAVLEEGEPSPSNYIKRLTEADIRRLNGAPSAVDEALARAVDGRIVRALPVAKDGTILSYLPAWDHGRVDWIAVANNNGGHRGGVRALIGLPPVEGEDGDEGRRFLLALYSRKTTVGDDASPVEAVALTSGWAESTSWDEAPDAAPSPFASSVLTPGEGWKLFDVTPLLRSRADSKSKPHGLMLRFAREDVGPGGNWSGYEFVSREGQPGRRPMLLVVEPAN